MAGETITTDADVCFSLLLIFFNLIVRVKKITTQLYIFRYAVTVLYLRCSVDRFKKFGPVVVARV